MKVTYDDAVLGAVLGTALGAVLGAVLAGALCRPRGCAKWQDSQLKADRDDYKAGAAVEAREADRLREELATAKQEHDSLVIEISDDRKMLTLLSTQLVQAKAVFNEPSFEAFLAKRLGAYSDEGFVTDTFTTKDMVAIARDCAKWQEWQLKADNYRLFEALKAIVGAQDNSDKMYSIASEALASRRPSKGKL